MTAQPPDIAAAITAYIRDVRDALTAAGIPLDDNWRHTYAPPTARIHTAERRGRWQAVLEWDGTGGWSAGWFENTNSGGTVTDRAWLGIAVGPAPVEVARAACDWKAVPDTFTRYVPAQETRPLTELLAGYLPEGAPRARGVGAGVQLERLRVAMAADGLDRAGHKRAAELLLATDGDLAAALVHATLADGDTTALEDELAEVRGELEEAHASSREAQAEAGGAKGEASQALFDLKRARAALEEVRAAKELAERQRTRLESELRAEIRQGDAWADRTHKAEQDRDRYRVQARAVRDLCGELRQEGLAGVARRVEGAMQDADIAAVQQHASAQHNEPDADAFAGLDDDEPTLDTIPTGPHDSRLLAGECRCGEQIDRGQFGDEPWRHTGTGHRACVPRDPRSPVAEPVTDRPETQYKRHLGAQVAVTRADGATVSGVLVDVSVTALFIDTNAAVNPVRDVPLDEVQHFTPTTDTPEDDTR